MTKPKRFSLLFALAMLPTLLDVRVRPARADEPLNPSAGSFLASTEVVDEGFDPPVGDPWYSPPPQQSGGRQSPADRMVFKMRITPHWFDQNNRFWYRNDLPGGSKEFILVDAGRGSRRPAFDHARLAGALSKAAGKVYHGDRLSFDEIEFVANSKAVRFECDNVTWTCSLESYTCSKTEPGKSAPVSSGSSNGAPGPRRRRTTDERPGPDAPGPRKTLRSPDGKWSAVVKDHNVFVRAEGKDKEIPLTTDGKEGLTYGRLSWSPDSKTLVAFRIEPGDKKEVYLIQSSPTGGGRAKLKSRPYELPGDKFTAYELNLIDVAATKAIRPKLDRIDFGSPDIRWDKDGRHFTYEKTDRGHQRFRLIRVDRRPARHAASSMRRARRSSGPLIGKAWG